MLRLLIAGKDSFVGEAVRRCLGRYPDSFRVDALDMRSDAWRSADFSIYDSLLHVAGIAHVTARADMEPLYMAVNRDLAVEAARKARDEGVRQFVFMSSMTVYGDAAPVGRRRFIGPGDVPAPAGPYGRSKLEAEEGIRALTGDSFRAAILRPPMIYGSGCRGNYNALRAWCDRMPVFPDVDNRRSVLYIENLTEFLRQLLLSGQGGMFFPRNRESASTTEIMRCIARARGKNMRFARLFNPGLRLAGRLGPVRRAFGDMAYGPDVPDWPENYNLFDLDESIRRTEAR